MKRNAAVPEACESVSHRRAIHRNTEIKVITSVRSFCRRVFAPVARAISARLVISMVVPLVVLSGCYVIPVDQHGGPIYAVGAPAVPPPVYQTNSAPQVVYAGPPMPALLNVRLYPANELANQTGMMTGTVSNMMSGKGRFQFDYRGELLSGEATRVSGDDRRGVASAYGVRGTFVSCEYQMASAQQGAGTCTFNNGAKYQVHIGG
jgi:hypothetical protein